MIMRLSLNKDKDLIFHKARDIFYAKILNNINGYNISNFIHLELRKNGRRFEGSTMAEFFLKWFLTYFQLLYFLNMLPDGGSALLDQHGSDPHIK